MCFTVLGLKKGRTWEEEENREVEIGSRVEMVELKNAEGYKEETDIIC